MADVFLSYKTEDRELARVVVRGLEAYGLSVWWDQHIVMGDVWRSETTRQLDEAGAVVVLWTRTSTGAIGRFVQEEAARAQRRGTYMPVQMDDCELPLGFSETQALQLAHWDGNSDDPQFQRLIGQIRRMEAAGGIGQAAASAASNGAAAASRAAPAAAPVSLATESARSERRSVTMLRGELMHPSGALDDPEYLDESMAVVGEVIEAGLDGATSLLQDLDGTHFTCVFGLPTGDEMAEQHAAGFALKLRDALRQRLQIGARMAIASGTAVVTFNPGEARPRVTSNLQVRADALLRAAEDGQVLVSGGGRRRLEPFFEISEVPGDGFAVIARTEVRDRIGAALRGGLTPLTGRAVEVAEIERAIAAVPASGGQAISVIGDAGIGKSRMLREAEERLERDGFVILRTDCEAHGRTAAFTPFRTVLRALFPEGALADEAQIAEAIPALAPYAMTLRYLAAPGPVDSHAGNDNPAFQNAACREAIIAALTLAATQRPLALLVDDYHFADTATRETLLSLASAIRMVPMLVLVAARPDTPPQWPPMPHCRQLVLAPLSLTDTETLLKAIAKSEAIVGGLPRIVHKRTDGIPYFVEELTQRLLASGDFSVVHGRLTTRAGFNPLDIPQSLQGLVQARLDQLDPKLRAIVQVAAVVGLEFEWAVLRDLLCLEGAPSAYLGPAIDAGLVHQLRIVPEPAYRFSQQMIQHVAAGNLLLKHRRELHQRIAELIERREDVDAPARAERLAHHYAEAGCDARAVEFLLEAAERALNWGSAQVAAEMADRAVKLLEAAASEARNEALLRRAYVVLGEGLHLSRGFEDPALVELIEKLRGLCAEGGTGQDDIACSWLIWRYDYVVLRFEEAAACAANIARIAAATGDPVARMLAKTGTGVVEFFLSDVRSARANLEEAGAIAEQLPATASGLASTGAFFTYLFLANAKVQAGEPVSAQADFDRARAIAERTNAVSLTLMVDSYRQMALQMMGDIDACEILTNSTIKTALEHELYHVLVVARMMAAATALARGQIAAAQEMLREIEPFFESDDNSNARLFLTIRMLLALATGDEPGARACADRLRRAQKEIGSLQLLFHVARADLLLDWSSDPVAAEARAREANRRLIDSGNILAALVLSIQLATTLIGAGRGADARAILEETLALFDPATIGNAPIYRAAEAIIGKIEAMEQAGRARIA